MLYTGIQSAVDDKQQGLETFKNNSIFLDDRVLFRQQSIEKPLSYSMCMPKNAVRRTDRQMAFHLCYSKLVALRVNRLNGHENLNIQLFTFIFCRVDQLLSFSPVHSY